MNPLKPLFDLVQAAWKNFSKFLVLATPASIIGSAFLDPQGAVNGFLCRMIDLIVAPLPSTPAHLKIGHFATSFAQALPFLGWGVVSDIFSTIMSCLFIFLLIKLYKLIPFKAS